MTTYRLMDGIAGRPGTGSSGTQPPGAPTSYVGNLIAGLVFKTTAATWLQGYWWYVPAGGDTGPVKFALWQMYDINNTGGLLVPGSTVTSGTLTAGQFNFTALPVPLALSQQTRYVAAAGFSTLIGFPDSSHQFGAGNPYSSGITNGPLSAYPSANGIVQMPHEVSGSDPGVTYPFTNNTDDNLWLDVQVTDVAPPGTTYRIWPSRPFAIGDNGAGGASVDTDGFTMSMQFSLTQPCQLNKAWFYSAQPVFGVTPAAALPTRCAVWDVLLQAVVADTDNPAVSWKKPDGTAAAAGAGWVYCDYTAAQVALAGGRNYKIAVWYAGGAMWRTVYHSSSAGYDYWAGTGDGANGFTYGPLVVPNAAHASPYQDSWNGPNLPWTYPASFSSAENDWVDVEVQPVAFTLGKLTATDQRTGGPG